MLKSLALIFVLSIVLSKLAKKMNLPALLGMLIAGIILGSSGLNLLDDKIISISAELRKIALVIILTRAGLALDLNDLKKSKRPAILMSFIPASVEMLLVVLLAPKLLGITVLDAAIMASVLAAVSPAVIVPKMIYLIENKFGSKRSVPQLIMASASVDDIFVIVLFSSFIALAQGGRVSFMNFILIPVSIVLGAIVGYIVAFLLSFLFKHFDSKDTIRILILLSTAFLLLEAEELLKGILPFSALISIMCMGLSLKKSLPDISKKISAKYSEMWSAAEILLFALVGASVNIDYAFNAGFKVIILIFIAVLFRMLGVLISLTKSHFNKKERVFCMIAYSPKATVQAAIGAVPLSLGLPCGDIVLTVAVLSILITAPLGAFGIDIFHKKLLSKTD